MAKKTKKEKKSWKRLENFEHEADDFIQAIVSQTKKELKESAKVVAGAMANYPHLSCKIHCGDDINQFIEKWVVKFSNGFDGRPSQKIGNKSKTKPDTIIEEIIKARITGLSDDNWELIKHGHDLAMAAENIAGALLEEFLSIHLAEFGWHSCWGETMRSIDFCNANGELLQIKNSDNSENSSSKAIREGTDIKHWFRRFATKGGTNWEALNELIGITDNEKQLTEEKYVKFVQDTIEANPMCLALEDDNPWEEETETDEKTNDKIDPSSFIDETV